MTTTPDPRVTSVRPKPDVRTATRTSTLIWTGFLFVFAVLLASFPARNPTLWLQLQNGRDVLSARFGGLNPEWLFEVGCYLLHTVGGGAGLVAVKALAVGVLGLALVRTGMARGSGYFLATFCAGLAVMTLSLAANVQPVTVTLVALGVSLWWLRESRDDRRVQAWPLFVLFLIWANADRGVITGLLVVLCVWAGRALDVKAGRAVRGFGWWPLGLIAVVALNPVHFQGRFPLPAELGWLVGGFPSAVSILGPATDYPSPLTQTYVEQHQDSPARLAYYPLLFVGVLTFVLNLRQHRWQRFLPWLLTAGLSVVTDRAVPVFAVVGGPVLALNLGELFARSDAGTRRSGRWWAIPIGLFGLAFLVAAWPGWLQGPPYEPRRWTVEIPNSPQLGCERLREYRESNRFAHGTRTLHLSPESAKIASWFDPTDDGAFDDKIALGLSKGETPPELAKRMKDGRFTRLVVYHPNVEQVRVYLPTVLAHPRQWPLLFVRGGVAVFGWQDPAEPTTTRGLDLSDPWADLSDPHSAAVPTERYRTRSRATLGWFDQVREWFATPTQLPSVHRDEAALWLVMADASETYLPERNRDVWPIEQWVALAGSAAGYTNPFTAGADATLRVGYTFTKVEEVPPFPALVNPVGAQLQLAQRAKSDYLVGPLFASIRSARRAIAETPNEPTAHLILGEAYLRVMTRSRYRAWAGPDRFPKAANLLQAQTVAAYHRGLDLSRKPPYQANRQLADLYRQIGYLDLSLKHLIDARTGRKPIANERARRKIEDREGQALDGLIEQLGKAVADQQARYEAETRKALTTDRVAVANGLMLQGRALDLLLESDVSAFGAEGTNLQLNLFLRTGRADEVIDWSVPTTNTIGESKNTVESLLGSRTYHWYRGQALAASGASVEADVELAGIEGGATALIPDPQFLGQRAALITADKVLAESPRVLGVPDSVARMILQIESERQFSDLHRLLRDMAEVCVLRAMIAAESGDLAKTKTLCHTVLEFSPVRTGGIEDPLRKIANDFLAQIAAHERGAAGPR